MTVKAEWQIEDFEEMNPPAPGQRLSPLQHLSRVGATNGHFLGVAQDILENNPASVICFAQLPCRVGSKVQKVTRPGTSRLFELQFHPATLAINYDGSQELLPTVGKTASTPGIECTQVLGWLRYWGIRAKWYRRYAQKVSFRGLQEGQIVPSADSWLSLQQPLDASAFENDLARRLIGDFWVAIRRALPVDLVDSYRSVLNFFIMPHPGRISFGGKPIPTLREVRIVQPLDNRHKPKPVIKKKQSVFLSYVVLTPILQNLCALTLRNKG